MTPIDPLLAKAAASPRRAKALEQPQGSSPKPSTLGLLAHINSPWNLALGFGWALLILAAVCLRGFGW